MKLKNNLIIVLLLFVICANAQVPPTISYQGYLTEDTGQPVTDGSYSILFTMYDDSLAGTALWRETQTIDVIDGVFHTQLGAVDSLDLPFNNAYYLALTINGGQPLIPRVKLTSSAYSLTSRSVWGEDNIFPSSDYVGIGTTTPSHELTVHGDLRVTNQHRLLFGVDVSGEYIYNADGQTLRIHVGDEDRMHFANNGDVGIGTVTPSEKLHVDGTIYSSSGGFRFPDGTLQTTAADTSNGTGYNTLDQAYDQGGPGAGRSITADAGAFEVSGVDGILFSGTYGSGTIPAEGEGTRMMWYPAKAAFRVGDLSGSASDFWDDDSIGLYSLALGPNTRSLGLASVALGANANASGGHATAIGLSTKASGLFSTAIGRATRASGHTSSAIGYLTNASGQYSIAMGVNTIASGDFSTALGDDIESQGDHSIAVSLSDQNGLVLSQANTMAIMGGKVGIETIQPNANFEVGGTDGVLFSGTFNSGNIPTEGFGTRMMWYPAKAAFRVGRVDATGSAETFWDDDSIGNYSLASGSNTVASGSYSTAMGFTSKALAQSSTALGQGTVARGPVSTALGGYTDASGSYSLAVGNGSEATGSHSMATGYNTNATGQSSFSGGELSTASGSTSTALGFQTQAVGSSSFSIGSYSEALGVNSIAMGNSTTASGNYSTAMGVSTTASGVLSTALGNATVASGHSSTAMGLGTAAGGSSATAMGQGTSALGDYSTAMGANSTASSNYSTAIGRNVTVSGTGSMVLGDATAISFENGADNRFAARFSNGYFLYTNIGATIGVALTAGSNSWGQTSDSTKKENFKPVNGEELLNKINQFKLGSWNYIGQDKTQFRHYGPMAQDFYNAFGNDGIGKIGNDTTIASADFDGINFIAIQALGKRTMKNEKRINESDERINSNEKRIMKNEIFIDDSRKQIVEHDKLITKSQQQIAVLQNELAEMKTLLKDLETMIKNKAVILSDSEGSIGMDSSLRSE